MSDHEDKIDGFHDDDGTKIDPNLMEKPSLCIACRKDDEKNEEAHCVLNRIDQQGEDGFMCEAYVSKFEEHIKEDEGEAENDE